MKQERKDLAKSFGFQVDEEQLEDNDENLQNKMLKREEEKLK